MHIVSRTPALALAAALAFALSACSGSSNSDTCTANCSIAPPAECSGDTLVEYGAFLGCTGDQCEFTTTETPCVAGCSDGACVSDPCLNVVCDAPPAPTCLGDTIVRYASDGICEQGACRYAAMTEACTPGTSCELLGGQPTCETVEPLCILDGVRNGVETDIDCGGTCPPCSDGLRCERATDCASLLCTDGLCASPTCDDGVQNGDEVGVDCGPTCGICPVGSSCRSNTDCVTGVCADGECASASCSDRVTNGTETGRDCGGSCPGCPGGESCGADGDCISLACVEGICDAPACFDGILNQGELDVDCGGPCPPCGVGSPCNSPRDCLTGLCTDGICRGPTCDDGELNGAESDVDCGGGCPERCVVGDTCNTARDCQTGACTSGLCADPACDDAIRNGDESDVDCGGPCGFCEPGLRCRDDVDCDSGRCASGRCAVPTCLDGIFNGEETALDCGGLCPGCPDGAPCNFGTDCESLVCDAGFCAAPTCEDGVMNGTETGMDCGGPCPNGCDLGGGCETGNDCNDLTCITGVCAAVCDDGRQNGTESDVDCGGFCLGCVDGLRCTAGFDCRSRSCPGAARDGESCLEDSDCASGTCIDASDPCEAEFCNPVERVCLGDCPGGDCSGLCEVATCDDGIQNGGELAADCGGPCGDCVLECDPAVRVRDLSDFAISAGLWRDRGAETSFPESSISFFDTPSCAGPAGAIGPEVIYRFVVEQAGLYRITTALTGTELETDTLVYVFVDVCDPNVNEDISCGDDPDGDLRGSTEVRLRRGDVAFIVVDSQRPRFASTNYALEVERLEE